MSGAVFAGDLDAVLRLLSEGADPDEDSALIIAAGRGWTPICKALLAAGADPNSIGPEGVTPLWAAVQSRNSEVLQACLTAGARVDVPSAPGPLTPLMHAARVCFLDGMRLLLDYGADISARAAEGATALTVSIRAHQLDAVKLLLDRGADVEQLGWHETTPLCLAARHGCVTVLDYLLHAGADPERTTEDGWSPLALAAYQGHVRALRVLLKAGADPNSRDVNGRTPLIWASWRAFRRCYELLLQHGADPTLRATTEAEPVAASPPLAVQRRHLPFTIAPFRRLALEILWAAALKKKARGVSVGVCILSAAEGRAALHALEEAFSLIEHHDKRIFEQLRINFKRILLHSMPASPAFLLPGPKCCVLRWPGQHTKESAIRFATSLIHELTHARLFALKFGYRPSQRLRIERLCIKASLNFVNRLPTGKEKAHELRLLLERLSPRFLSESDRISRMPKNTAAPGPVVAS